MGLSCTHTTYPTCCHHCQQELTLLRVQYQSLLCDFPPLKEQTRLARQTLQIYKDENVQLNRVRVDLQARVTYLQGQLKENQGSIPERADESAKGRREGRKVDELNRVIMCKNSEIVALKQQLSWKNYDCITLRKKTQEIQSENVALKSRVRVLEGMARNMTIITNQQKSKTQQDTLTSQKLQEAANDYYQTTSHKRNILPVQTTPCCSHHTHGHSGEKVSNFRLNMIQSKIEQLQHENTRLRQHLITKV